MTDDELLDLLRDVYEMYGQEYPDPPTPNHYNRATRREHDRERRRYWRNVRREGSSLARALGMGVRR